MNFIYYCDKCKKVHTVDQDSKVISCPDCKRILLPTHITSSEWTAKTDEEKEKKILSFENASKSIIKAEKDNSTSNNTDNSEKNKTNSIAKTLNILGWIYIILTIVGTLVLINDENEFWLAAAFLGVLAGVLVLGIGEIVKLLQEIKDKL